nr:MULTISPECIES: TonB-dependent receptor [Xanthomonas]
MSMHTDLPHPQRLSMALRSAMAAPLLCTAFCAIAQDTPNTLSTIFVSQDQAVRDTPASTGTSLGLSPFQTPASLDVITRDQLDARGDSNVTDAITRAGAISAMAHPGNGLSALSTRGFTDSASVMRLYDGLRQYGGVGVTFPFDTWSIERIEVLRGPASVIYGDGAIGGVVNIIPKMPSAGAIQNDIQATLGTQDTARLAFGSGGGLTDTLSYRMDVSGNATGGWVDRGRAADATFSGALRWQIAPTLHTTLRYAYGYQTPMRYFGTPLVDGRQLPALRHQNYNISDGVIRFRDQWTQLDTVWTPTAALTLSMRLYHIDSQRDWRNAEAYLYDAATRLIDRSDNTAIGHDQQQTGLTANSVVRGRVGGFDNTFSFGVDANDSRFQHTNNTYVGSAGPVDPYAPVPGRFSSDIPTIPRYRNSARQYAVFLENRLALSTAWSVLGGMRYDHATLDRQNLVAGTQAFSTTFSNVGWRVGTVYDLQPGLALYAQYARAADPVGGLLMLSPANSRFAMSQGRQTEVGLKQAFAQGRGEWTLAAYHIRKSDLLTRDPVDPDLRVQVGAQSTRGIEASLSLATHSGWQLDLNATALRARYDDFTEATGTPAVAISRAGNVPPNVAARLANAWLSWNFQPDWTAAAGLRYVGTRYADTANALALPGYTTTDVSLRWQVRQDTALTARIYNLFDKAYFTTAYYTETQWLYGPDRRVEFTVNHRF